jgi:putative membrane protein
VRLLKLLIFLVLMIVGAAFAVMNAENVNLNYYFGTGQFPLSMVLVGSLCAGAVLGVLATIGSILRLKHENGELRRKARLASEEVNNLRALPLKDQ